MIPWDDRADYAQTPTTCTLEDLDGDVVLDDLQASLDKIPGIKVEILNLVARPGLGQACASASEIRRLGSSFWPPPILCARNSRKRPGLIDIEDNLPLPGIDWQIDVDVEKAGRYGAERRHRRRHGPACHARRAAGHDARRQLGRGNRHPRAPAGKRPRAVDTGHAQGAHRDGLVPLSNFITREPVAQLAQINRVDQKRFFDVKAGVADNLVKLVANDGTLVDLVSGTDVERGGPWRPASPTKISASCP